MAIIEDVDSDSEEEQQQQTRKKPFTALNHADNVRDNIGHTASSEPVSQNSRLEKLLRSKGNIQESNLIELLEDNTLETLWNDLLDCLRAILRDRSANELDISRLERLTSIFQLIQRGQDEHLSAPSASVQPLERALDNINAILVIPCHFMLPEYEITPEIAHTQAYWRAGSIAVLQLLHTLLYTSLFSKVALESTDAQANLIITLSRFLLPERGLEDDGLEYATWSTPLTSSIAKNILHTHLLPAPPTPQDLSTLSLSRHTLLKHIKPLFSQVPHKDLHPETGRKLERQRGGDQFSDSWVEEVWKGKTLSGEKLGAVGCWKVFEFVMGLLESKDMEEIWPMLVPPLMTLLDDHEVKYRSQGVRSLAIFLKKVPASLLVRTGLNDLIQRALTTTYSFTSESSNIPTIRASFYCNLQLTHLLYPPSSLTSSSPALALASSTTPLHRSKIPQLPPSMKRFNSLCSIHQNLILSIFAYQSSSIPFMTLAFTLLPYLLSELGKTSIRFLGDTIQVLNASLGDSHAARGLVLVFSNETMQMYIAALQVLKVIIGICNGTNRINRYRAGILGSLATVWCNIKETDKGQKADTLILEREMKEVVRMLRIEGGVEGKKDVQRILALDPKLFGDLCNGEEALDDIVDLS